MGEREKRGDRKGGKGGEEPETNLGNNRERGESKREREREGRGETGGVKKRDLDP